MDLANVDDAKLLTSTPSPLKHDEQVKDRFFSLLFIGNIICILFIAVFFGLPNISYIYFTMHLDGSSSHGLKIVLIFLSTSCLGAVVSTIWFHIMQRYANQLISWTLKLSIAAFLIIALFGFFDSGKGGRVAGLLNLFMAFMLSIYYSSVKNSIPFATMNLSVASRIMNMFSDVVFSAYVMITAQIIWVVIWSVAAIGVLAKSAKMFHDSSSLGNTCFFFLLLSLLWTLQVGKNVVHCIAAGTVGEWWFGSFNAETVKRSRLRAMSSSLGSISLGSLIVAFLTTFQMLFLSTRRRKSHGSANACLECVVKLVSHYIQYFNKFAFCQVAIYGKDFQTAGYDTMKLFRERGWSALVNDSLISGILDIGCLLVGGISGVIGSSWVFLTLSCKDFDRAAHPEQCETFNVVVLTFFACSFIGYTICSVISSILDSIVSTIFVCFAMDPAALQRSHPHEYASLVEGWRRIKPELVICAPNGTCQKSYVHV